MRACSICSFARRNAPSASRIWGCGSAGIAVAGVAGSAFAAGVAGVFVLFGAACVDTRNANARINEAAAKRPTILPYLHVPLLLVRISARTAVIAILPVCMTYARSTLESDQHAPCGAEPPFLKTLRLTGFLLF